MWGRALLEPKVISTQPNLREVDALLAAPGQVSNWTYQPNTLSSSFSKAFAMYGHAIQIFKVENDWIWGHFQYNWGGMVVWSPKDVLKFKSLYILNEDFWQIFFPKKKKEKKK